MEKCFRQKLTLGVMTLCAAIKGCMSKFLETLLFGLQHEQSLCGLSIFWLNFLEVIQRREPLSVRTVAYFMMYMTSDVEHPIIIFSLQRLICSRKQAREIILTLCIHQLSP